MSYLGKVDMNDANVSRYYNSGIPGAPSSATEVVFADLGWTPTSANTLRITINGVVQQNAAITSTGVTWGGAVIATDELEIIGIESVGNIITPADNSVTTAKLADDSVTLAKMAGLARGKIIVGDSSGDPSALTVGAANQVLKSDGADVAWGADVGGALVHLHTTTVDAEVTEIAINDVFTSAYTNYRIVFNNILPVASNNTIYMAFRETSVSAVVNMHSITRWFGVNSAGSLVYGDSPEYNMGGTELFYTATDDGGMNGYVEVFNPFLSGSADWTRTIVAMNGYVVNASGWTHVYGAAQATATTSTPCFKVWAGGSDPNIGDASIDGFVRVYGYKDS